MSEQPQGPGAPPEGPFTPDEEFVKPENILTQFSVILTKDEKIAVQFPVKEKGSTKVDINMALDLLSAGLTSLSQIFRQQNPPEPSRIVLAPAIPNEFLLKEKFRH